MSQDRIEFVDSISPSAAVRLSLSAHPFSVLDNGTSLPPPGLKRVTVSTMLEDGSIIPAAAYENRTLTIHVQVQDRKNPAATIAQIQRLNRELDRGMNVLRWQPEPSVPAVYFRTFRAPDYSFTVDHGTNLWDIVLSIPAEPFAYGEAEDSADVVVRNNPQDPDNPKFFEITGIKGDVETPLIITVDAVMWYHQSVFATRRGGTPANAPRVLEAESMTMGTNTVVTASGTAYSGTGTNNTAVTTFTTNNIATTRLSVGTFPATPSPDVRGTYRVFARLNTSVANSSYRVRLYHGKRGVFNDSAVYTIFNTNRPVMVDCGLVQLPEGFDPQGIGPSGSRLSVAGGNFSFGIERTAGTGNAIWDYILFVPADDRFCIVNWGTVETSQYVMDGYQRAIYGMDASNNVIDIGAAYFTGDPPLVSPGVTNRVTYINDVSPTPGADDFNSWTATLTYTYFPRYLYVRPVNL